MLYNKSPYLIFNPDISITNLLTEKRLRLKRDTLLYHTIKELPDQFDENLVRNKGLDREYLLNKKYIFKSDIDPFQISLKKYASIEINAHCNSRCKFCPVSENPYERQFIEDELFEMILKQLKELNSIRWISLNHYNEPLLDSMLHDKIMIAGSYGLKIRLFTNGKNLKPSFFNEGVIDNLDFLVLNIPTIKKGKYKEITGTNMPKDFVDNISKIIRMNLPVEIAINGRKEEAIKEKLFIDKYFELEKYKRSNSYINITNTRSGLLTNEYVNLNNKYKGRLKGCRRFSENITIGINGEVFICCQDYHKTNIVGNIKDKPLLEILNSDPYITLKRRIFGYEPVDDSFICRSCNELVHESE